MGYFGGGGVQGILHPSLRTYIECFNSPPFPKGWPRGGGIWDQDPELMKDFRVIRDYEIQWKQTQEQLNSQEGGSVDGGAGGLSDALEQYLNDLEEDGQF